MPSLLVLGMDQNAKGGYNDAGIMDITRGIVKKNERFFDDDVLTHPDSVCTGRRCREERKLWLGMNPCLHLMLHWLVPGWKQGEVN